MSKIKFNKRYESGKIEECVGNKHILKLSTGEKIIVATTRETCDCCKLYWNVTDIETGIALVGFYEHSMFLFFQYDNKTEKGALCLAIERIENSLKEKNTTYKELINKRLVEKVEE